MGTRTLMALAYKSIPVAITVEGANILTRSLMIFGQGAMRCHPYLYDELQAIQDEDQERGLDTFEGLFFKHAGHTLGNMSRGVVHGLSGAALAEIPANADSFSAPRSLSLIPTRRCRLSTLYRPRSPPYHSPLYTSTATH